MKKQKNNFFWQKLDNAAKIYPAITNSNSANVFRLSVKLNIPIERYILQDALINTLKIFPSFNVRLKKGLFWYYLEQNPEIPIVTKEDSFPCQSIKYKENDGFLFRVTYFNKKINLEVFHVLSDGTGAIRFLKNIVYNYLLIKFPNEIDNSCEIEQQGISLNSICEDSFLKYGTDNLEKKQIKQKSIVAYRIKGNRLPVNQTKVISGTFSTNKLYNLAKLNNSTITTYLASLLIFSIYNESYIYGKKSKPISICIPVNLRNFFPSETTKNFFSFITVVVPCNDKNLDFDKILNIVKNQIKSQLTKQIFSEKIKFTVDAQNNIFLRIIPLFLKDIVLNAIFKSGEKYHTSAFSNLGIIDIPKNLEKFIDRFEFLLNVDESQFLKMSLCSFKDNMTCSFVSNITDSNIQKFFFKYLSKKDIDINISCNEVDNYEEM